MANLKKNLPVTFESQNGPLQLIIKDNKAWEFLHIFRDAIDREANRAGLRSKCDA